MIVTTAFGAHLFKENACSQLLSASKLLLSQRRQFSGADKEGFIFPLVRAFVDRNIVEIKLSADFANPQSSGC